MNRAPLAEVKNLTKHFQGRSPFGFARMDTVKALDNVSMQIFKGETVGLVGESGSGKSTLARCLIRLMTPDSGQIFFDGKDITHARGASLLEFRKKVQMVFQDPYSSLNPKLTVGKTLGEPLDIHRLCKNPTEKHSRILELLHQVGLSEDAINKYPHEFSGGQRQRIGIARALAVEPELIICDEPVSALDVSIQAQIINLLLELQDKLKLSFLFISHDLKLVTHMSHRVAVLKKGQLVEITSGKDFFASATHPYCRQLIDNTFVVSQ